MANYKEITSIEEFDIFDGTFESIKDNLFMRLFNKNNLPLNRDKDTVPHINYADLVITYSVEQRTYFENEKGMYTYLITNEDMQMLKVDEETLRKTAIKNLSLKNSARVETIGEHNIRSHVYSPLTRLPEESMVMIDIKGLEKNKCSIFDGKKYGSIPITSTGSDVLLVSNRTQTFASVNLTNPEILEEVYNQFEENFYIIPCSVHEFLCVKSSYATDNGNKTERQAVEELEDMLEHINDVIQKDTSNILSYNIYYHAYDDACTMIVN